MIIIFQMWNFKLSDIDQEDIHKHAKQKKTRVFSVFENSNEAKGKNQTLVYPVLRYAHKIFLFRLQKNFGK